MNNRFKLGNSLTVSRTITQLKKKKLISVEHGSRVRIEDEEQLDELAEAL